VAEIRDLIKRAEAASKTPDDLEDPQSETIVTDQGKLSETTDKGV
jgi:hypothetical protein